MRPAGTRVVLAHSVSSGVREGAGGRAGRTEKLATMSRTVSRRAKRVAHACLRCAICPRSRQAVSREDGEGLISAWPYDDASALSSSSVFDRMTSCVVHRCRLAALGTCDQRA